MKLALAIALLFCACDDTPIVPEDLAVAPDLKTGDDAAVNCGGQSCNNGTPLCCVNSVNGNYTPSCVANDGCDDGGSAAICDGPEDCPKGQGCCLHLTTVQKVMGGPFTPTEGNIACAQMCDGNVEIMGMTEKMVTHLCHTPADCVGLMGSIIGGTPLPFDGCCSRSDVPTSFCAPSDPSWATLGKYHCP